LPDLQVLLPPVESQAWQSQACPDHLQQRAAGTAGAAVCPAAVPGGAGTLPARLLPAPHRGAEEPRLTEPPRGGQGLPRGQAGGHVLVPWLRDSPCTDCAKE
ncbi:hypothetical protein IHE44_0012754, partial [Lamprotornis superbus]